MQTSLLNLFKPWNLFQPRQVAVRLARRLRPPARAPQVVRLPWGPDILVDPRQHIGNQIWRNGVFDLALSEVLYRLTAPGDWAVDVGANIGYTASLLGMRVGSAGHLIAVEPHPDIFRRLDDNVGRFRRCPGFGRTTLLECALSDETGRLPLVCPEHFGTNDGLGTLERSERQDVRTVEVAVQRLDDVAGEQALAVVKIDVEGHELAVLRGAHRLLEAQRIRDIVYEDHAGPHSAVGAFLQQHGFTLLHVAYDLLGPRLLPITGPAPAREHGSPNFLATRDPQGAAQRCRPRGWQTLRRARGPSG